MKVKIEIVIEVSEELALGLIEWARGFSLSYYEDALRKAVIVCEEEKVVSVKVEKE